MRLISTAITISLVALGCGGGKHSGSDPTLPTDDLPEETPNATKPTEPPVEPPGHPRNDLIPRADLFGNPERQGVQISPDGKHLSWLAARDGVMNVWIAPADKLDEAKPITAETTRPVRTYFWAYDNAHLLYLQDQGGNENFHIFRVDLATGEATDLTPFEGARANVVGISAKQPNRIAVGINDRDKDVFDIYSIDLISGERTLLAKNDQKFSSMLVDNDLQVRIAGKQTDDGGVDVFAWNAKTKKWKAFDHFDLDDLNTSGLRAFDKKGTSMYRVDSRGRDTGALYKVDFKTKKKKLILGDDKADIGDVLLHPTDYTVQAVSVEWDKPRWVAIDKQLGKDLDAIAQLAPGFPTVASRTLDDKVWIVGFLSDTASPKYYRWDRAAQKGEYLFSARPALDAQPLQPMTPVVIKSRDGLDLVSYLTLPAGADADADGKADQPGPLMLYIHGGPQARDRWGLSPYHQLLANRGYAVLSINYRGSTGFGKAFINAGNKQWGKKMHDDLLDAVDWAVAEGIAPRDRVGIMGGSYGGYATLVGLSMTPDVFACGVDIVGPSSIATLLSTVPSYWRPALAVWYNRVGNPTTEEGKAALDAVSPLTHAAEITKPLLIGQGANDPRVKKAESDQIVAAMQAQKIPVSYVVFPDEGHGFARPVNSIAFIAVTEAFLSVHLGGWYQPIDTAELSASTMQIEAGREWLPGLP